MFKKNKKLNNFVFISRNNIMKNNYGNEII